MTDLVNDLFRKRRKNDPVGWQMFAQQLRRINLPMELISNVDRRRYLRQTTVTATPLKRSRIPRWTVEKTFERTFITSQVSVIEWLGVVLKEI